MGHPKNRSPLQTFARRRNWELKMLRSLEHELAFRFHCRHSKYENQGILYRTQTLSDSELEKVKLILDTFEDLTKGWKKNHVTQKIITNWKTFK